MKNSFILVLVILISCPFIKGQENNPPEFLLGAYMYSGENSSNIQYVNHEELLEMGANAVLQRAIKPVTTLNQISNLDRLAMFPNIVAFNDSGFGTGDTLYDAQPENIDWISYMTHAKYRKWEAEGDPVFASTNFGIKHQRGNDYNEDSVSGWRTDITSQSGDSLIYGPYYWQYPRYTFSNPEWNPKAIEYKAHFRMRIDTIPEAPLPVCSLLVTMSRPEVPNSEVILKDTLLTTHHFNGTQYTSFALDYDYSNYLLPPQTNNQYGYMPGGIEAEPGYNLGTQVQFKVIWLGHRNLFVDYIEVYDVGPSSIWQRFFNTPQNYAQMISNIRNYDEEFKANTSFYSNLKYYITIDEPHSLDCLEPLRIVQHILDSINVSADLLTHWAPGWNALWEYDNPWPIYKKLVNPKKLHYWDSPYVTDENFVQINTDFTLYMFRANLQSAHEVQPGFTLAAQTFGWKNLVNNRYVRWKMPNSSEIKAETMLALAHGCKGILYELYYSYCSTCDNKVEGLVDYQNGSFLKTPQWYTVKDLAFRLKGSLGKTLMSIEYDTTYLRFYPYSDDILMRDKLTEETVSQKYLTLAKTSSLDSIINFHAGFFSALESENNYFLLTNLYVKGSRGVKVTVNDNGYGYNNMRFRNIEYEYDFDNTFNNSATFNIIFPAGEGYLYQVAPVVKFGGKLIYDESTADGTLLKDTLIIDNNATLTINGTYNAYKDIIIRSGSIVLAQGGKINFFSSKLIIEGNAVIQGTVTNKPQLDFLNSGNNGIEILSGGFLNISNCKLENAPVGILANVNTLRLVSSGVEFLNCGNTSVAMYGYEGLSGSESPSPSEIVNCVIDGSPTGILAVNMNEVIIRNNLITNTDLGITVCGVTTPYIESNHIYTGSRMQPGIMMLSSNGVVSTNTIHGHSNGIHLGNSSPDLAYNRIYDNKYHGLYIGAGSFPGLSPRNLNATSEGRYDISGFNEIYENGGWAEQGGPSDNDGSEIYFSGSNFGINRGCNSIYDDRVPDLSQTVPLENTIYLMNGRSFPEEIRAEGNYWGEDSLYQIEDRFGNLNVIYSPYLNEPCDPQDSDEALVLRASNNEVIDTIYNIGALPGNLTSTEISYTEADFKFIALDYEGAEAVYNQIISGTATIGEKLPAFIRLYETGKLNLKPAEYFNNLYSMYISLVPSTTDSLMKKIFTQLGSLSLIARNDYITAIDEFDYIVQLLPDTEEAFYAEVDALTTALLVENDSTRLNKTAAGKYIKKTAGDYLSSINKLFKKNLAVKPVIQEVQIPEAYHLYQNYPNPFNPVTKIRYDIPNASTVSCSVYDILGRKVKDLIQNELKQPGTYETSFDASGLASGIYLYRLRADDYVSTKKMTLIK